MELIARLNPGKTLGDRILKVNHAGEHGAVNIYRGQALLCRFRCPSLLPELLEFRTHEEKHRSIFWQELVRRGQRRCRSYTLCAVGGFVLGAFTGLCGRSAVAATTVAVEKVVLRHLKAQLVHLNGTDEKAFNAVSAILADEQSHHDHAALQTKQGGFWPRVLTPIVSGATEAVIWLGMRI